MDTINGGELERINSELFGSFDPEDETWIVGGGGSITSHMTLTPSGYDYGYDYDIDWSLSKIEGAT